jgi:zinc transport system permease protein
MVSVGTLAIGYLIMNVFSKSTNLAGDVCAILFGSASFVTLTKPDVWLSAGLSVLVIAVFLLFYHKIFAVTFDEDFATATGNRSYMYNVKASVSELNNHSTIFFKKWGIECGRDRFEKYLIQFRYW